METNPTIQVRLPDSWVTYSVIEATMPAPPAKRVTAFCQFL